jgi:hypothetical protein
MIRGRNQSENILIRGAQFTNNDSYVGHLVKTLSTTNF